MIMKTNQAHIQTFVTAFAAVLATANRVAQDTGYGTPLTEVARLRVAEAMQAAVDAFGIVAQDVVDAIVKASYIFGTEAGGMLSQEILALQRRIETNTKRAADERREKESQSWLNR